MAEKKSIYRKEALAKVASPDQLDTRLSLVSPMGWILLIIIAILLAVAGVWGVFGNIPSKVEGQGILIDTAGIKEVCVPVNGILSSFSVNVGDKVEKGQVIARLYQPDIVFSIRELKNELELLDLLKQESMALQNRKKIFQQSSLKNLEAIYKSEQTELGQALKSLQNIIRVMKKLEAKGGASKLSIHNMLTDMISARKDFLTLKNELNDIPMKEFLASFDAEKALQTWREQLQRQQLKMEQMIEKYEYYSVINSPFSGEVVEIDCDVARYVNAGTPLLKLVDYRLDTLQAVLYVHPADGKKLKRGMKAYLSPSVAQPQKYGYIEGLITYVSDLPVSEAAMLSTIQNRLLVQDLALKEPPIEVRVELIPATNNVSGYRWTSSQGPPFTISHGTLCSAEVIVRREPPLCLIMPFLRKYLLGIKSPAILAGIK